MNLLWAARGCCAEMWMDQNLMLHAGDHCTLRVWFPAAVGCYLRGWLVLDLLSRVCGYKNHLSMMPLVGGAHRRKEMTFLWWLWSDEISTSAGGWGLDSLQDLQQTWRRANLIFDPLSEHCSVQNPGPSTGTVFLFSRIYLGMQHFLFTCSEASESAI